MKKEPGIGYGTVLKVYLASLIVSDCPSASWKLDDWSIVNFPFTATVLSLKVVYGNGLLFFTSIENVLCG